VAKLTHETQGQAVLHERPWHPCVIAHGEHVDGCRWSHEGGTGDVGAWDTGVGGAQFGETSARSKQASRMMDDLQMARQATCGGMGRNGMTVW